MKVCEIITGCKNVKLDTIITIKEKKENEYSYVSSDIEVRKKYCESLFIGNYYEITDELMCRNVLSFQISEHEDVSHLIIIVA